MAGTWTSFYILFAIQETPQVSTGFTPSELLFRRSWDHLDIAKEAWEEQQSSFRMNIKHVKEMKDRINREDMFTAQTE